MASYPDTLHTFYDRNEVSANQVRSDRLHELEQYSELKLELSNINVTLESGPRAIAIFEKSWSFYGNKYYMGSARQEVWLAKLDGRWRITGEKDLQRYYVDKQK